MSYLSVPEPATPARRPAAAAWVLRALAAAIVAGVAVVGVQMYQMIADHSPVLVYTGHDSAAVSITPAKFSGPPMRHAVVRVVNRTGKPVDLRALTTLSPVPAADSQLAGTITAALTVEGTQVRSGALHGLTSPVLHLEPGATVPVTVEVVVGDDSDAVTWGATDQVSLTVAPVTQP